ncbi:bacteriohemerythrin [Breznakiellaceae bacterium SP9]
MERKLEQSADMPFVEWEDRLNTGIPLIDTQHEELLDLTNELYEACQDGKDAASALFKEAIKKTVDYVKFHFDAEQKILERIKYPDYAAHKAQHDVFVKKVLENVKGYEQGKNFVPNTFVRFLKEWVLTHIAVEDKKYADYILHLKKAGKFL